MSSFYIPSSFKVENEDFINSIINEYSFATLVVTQDNIPHTTHIPLLYDSTARKLKGHLAKINPVAKLDLLQPYHCLVIFQGPNSYVSPTWYATKSETHKVVPTWNYITIHVTGTLNLISESDWLLSNLSQLTEKHESGLTPPWNVSDAPKTYIDTLMKAIVGVEIAITDIKASFKLSQNKNEADFNGVLQGLRSLGTPQSLEVAGWMEKFAK